MLFSQAEYARLHEIVFADDYPGYRPSVVELPNGDGVPDRGKRYAHVARKYLAQCLHMPRKPFNFLVDCLDRAHSAAQHVADRLGVPGQYYPNLIDGTLRVLEYPSGADSAPHTDFDLFSILCYRSDVDATHSTGALQLESGGPHIGEIGEMVGLGPATRHAVRATDYVQHSLVYFAMPNPDAVLPSGETVRAWTADRIARSRAPR